MSGKRPVVMTLLFIGAYLTPVLLVQHNQDRSNAKFCGVSQQRWIVSRSSIAADRRLTLLITTPIPLPPAVNADGSSNAYGVHRTQVRNAQLADERRQSLADNDHLLALLGPEPRTC